MPVNFKAEDQFIEADTLIKENRIEEAVNLLIEILTDDPSFGKDTTTLDGYMKQK